MKLLIAMALLVPGLAWAQNAGGRSIHNEAERLAKWTRVEMPFHSEGLSARERQMVDRLVEACRLLDDIYWRQSDLGGQAMYKTTRNPVIKDLLYIMGSRWDLLDENKPFIGEPPMYPGHELFPHDLTRAAIEQYAAAHPAEKAALSTARIP